MRKHKGFTLVELVVVVMILGILAAVAAPKLLGTSSAATNNGLRQTLATVRDAIERYAAENGGELPGASDDTEATFKSDLEEFLRGSFPTCPVSLKDASVNVETADTDLAAEGTPTSSWLFNTTTGEFIVNSTDDVTGETGVTYDQL